MDEQQKQIWKVARGMAMSEMQAAEHEMEMAIGTPALSFAEDRADTWADVYDAIGEALASEKEADEAWAKMEKARRAISDGMSNIFPGATQVYRGWMGRVPLKSMLSGKDRRVGGQEKG